MQRALSNGWLNPELIAFAQAQREEKRPRFGRGRKKRALQRTRGQQALRASAWAILMGSAAFSYLAWSGTGSAVWNEWSGRTDLRGTQPFEMQQAVIADATSNANRVAAVSADNRDSINLGSIEGAKTLVTSTLASHDAGKTAATTSSSASNTQFEERTATEGVTPEVERLQPASERQVTNSLLKERVTELREEHLALRESIARVQQQLLTLAEAETAAEEAPQES